MAAILEQGVNGDSFLDAEVAVPHDGGEFRSHAVAAGSPTSAPGLPDSPGSRACQRRPVWDADVYVVRGANYDCARV